jgi:magnesium transporter
MCSTRNYFLIYLIQSFQLESKERLKFTHRVRTIEEQGMTEQYQPQTFEEVRRLLEAGHRHEAAALIAPLLPPDQAEIFEELTLEEQVRLLKVVEAGQAANILEALDEDDAANLAQNLGIEALTRVLDEMEPDEAADLLGDLTPDLRRESLDQMSDQVEVRSLLRYPDDTAGGLMTSEYYVFPEDTAGKIRKWLPNC